MPLLQESMNTPAVANPSRLPELSIRLRAVAEMVRPCDHLFDIGSDHAFLPIHLVGRGICRHATASDIGHGPVAVAQRNIDRHGLQAQIETAVTFGLDGHSIKANDVIVMAGLGGLEMIDILGPAPRMCQQIVLQPQKSAPELRLWLASHHYRIDDEQLVLDRDRLYTIISAHYSIDPGTPTALTLAESVIGPVLLNQQPPLFTRHLRRLASHLHKAVLSNQELLPVLAEVEKHLNIVKPEFGGRP
jgi:tRNA (adenine22-N1)-methyltransferase